MRALAALSCLAVGGILGGCGGSGSDPDPITFTAVGTPALDGFVNALGSVELSGDLAAGDQEGPGGQLDRGLRFFVSFDISALAPTLEIESATLRMTQYVVVDNPYGLGALLVDHVEYGTALGGGAYDRSPLASAFGTLSTTATLEAKTVSVTDQVQSDVTGQRGRSQYRIRFPIETNGDDVSNQAIFHSSESSVPPDQRPTLIITYRP